MIDVNKGGFRVLTAVATDVVAYAYQCFMVVAHAIINREPFALFSFSIPLPSVPLSFESCRSLSRTSTVVSSLHNPIFRINKAASTMCTVNVLSFLTLVLSFFIPHAIASVTKRTPAGSAISCTTPIEQGLGQQLSSGATIALPGSQAFTNANIRWSTAEHPDFAVVVTPATTQDVVAAVRPSPFPMAVLSTDAS